MPNPEDMTKRQHFLLPPERRTLTVPGLSKMRDKTTSN